MIPSKTIAAAVSSALRNCEASAKERRYKSTQKKYLDKHIALSIIALHRKDCVPRHTSTDLHLGHLFVEEIGESLLIVTLPMYKRRDWRDRLEFTAIPMPNVGTSIGDGRFLPSVDESRFAISVVVGAVWAFPVTVRVVVMVLSFSPATVPVPVSVPIPTITSFAVTMVLMRGANRAMTSWVTVMVVRTQ
jgi:hypothetical protein